MLCVRTAFRHVHCSSKNLQTLRVSRHFTAYYWSDTETEPESRMFKAVKNFFSPEIETPEYSIIEQNEEYELREYTSSKWVSSQVESMTYSKAGSTMFWRLFKYIQGNNVKEQKIAMTAPVTMHVKPGAGPACENTFTMSFFVPKEYHDDPAKPKAEEVFLTEFPKRQVYVRSFSGFSNEEKWLSEAQKLAESLGDKDDFHKDFFYTAGYDSPFKLFNRRNEIWFIVKDQDKLSHDSDDSEHQR
ncbi:heme-binding protein 2-like [Ptychodera flava]|uniref:heme-binding protein 2-like n=1 Tax=Ptychodera flava TaxID=63121 RepID=UPI003969D4EF